MTNILRYNAADDAFDDLFRGFFMRPVRFEGKTDVQMKVDVSEDDAAYTVHAEIPGVRKEDIHITVEGNQLSISAEVKDEKEIKEDGKLLRSERYYGKVSRAFSLAQEMDDSAAEAKYENGVLELRLPKRVAAPTKRIEVH